MGTESGRKKIVVVGDSAGTAPDVIDRGGTAVTTCRSKVVSMTPWVS